MTFRRTLQTLLTILACLTALPLCADPGLSDREALLAAALKAER